MQASELAHDKLLAAATAGDVTYNGSHLVLAYKDAPQLDAEVDHAAFGAAKGPVTLREISLERALDVLSLSTAPDQRRFVADNRTSLAQAALTPHAWFRGVHVGDLMVGFVMVDLDPSQKYCPMLWRFMVDSRQQGRGVGRRAIELTIEEMHRLDPTATLWTSVVEAPGGPLPFYERCGFVSTGDYEDGELVLRYERGAG